MSHVIPVKKNKENDFSMVFSASSDSSERFYRTMSIFGTAFDAASPPLTSAGRLVLLRSKQCFSFA